MKIKSLLKDKTKWTKGGYARNKKGTITGAFERDAKCWCLMGAVFRCYGRGRHPYLCSTDIREKIENYIQRKFPRSTTSVYEWNDAKHRNFIQVRGLIEELDI